MARNKAQTQNATPTQVADSLPSQDAGANNAAPVVPDLPSNDVQQDLLDQTQGDVGAGDQVQAEAPALIKMVSEHGLEADVHQDMIDEYKAGGYRLAEEV